MRRSNWPYPAGHRRDSSWLPKQDSTIDVPALAQRGLRLPDPWQALFDEAMAVAHAPNLDALQAELPLWTHAAQAMLQRSDGEDSVSLARALVAARRLGGCADRCPAGATLTGCHARCCQTVAKNAAPRGTATPSKRPNLRESSRTAEGGRSEGVTRIPTSNRLSARPAPSQLQRWTRVIDDSNGNGWGDFVAELMASPRYLRRVAEQPVASRVDRYYQFLLGRDADPAGADLTAREIAEGRGGQRIVDMLISAEARSFYASLFEAD